MLQFVFDTDHLTLFHHGNVFVGQRFAVHAVAAVGITVVTVEESLRGRLAALAQRLDGPRRIARYALLEATLRLLRQFPIASFDGPAEQHFQQLLGMQLRIGSQDLTIAAIALAHGLVVVSRNRRDFGRIPGLRIEDWSV